MTWTNPRSCADSPPVLYEMRSVKSPASQILLHHSISLFSLYCTSSPDISSYGGDGGVYLRKYFFLSCEKKCICKDESSFTGKEEIEEEYLSRNVNCSLERRSVFARKYIFLSSFCPFSGIPSASHWLHRHLIPLHYLHWPSFQSYSLTTFSLRFFDQKRKIPNIHGLLTKTELLSNHFLDDFFYQKRKNTHTWSAFQNRATLKQWYCMKKNRKYHTCEHILALFPKKSIFRDIYRLRFSRNKQERKAYQYFQQKKDLGDKDTMSVT